MFRFRYRLSWLLLLPAVLAVAIWWFKPVPVPAFEYCAEQRAEEAENFYWVKPRYVQDLLILYELRDCEYAVLVFGALWSTDDNIQLRALKKISANYSGRVPFFLCDLTEQDWSPNSPTLKKTLPNYRPSMKTQGFVGVVHRGRVIATLSGPGEALTAEEYQQKIDACLPWNYKL